MSMKFFKSKEEREQDSQNYISLVFPLGLEQRDCVKTLLDDLFPKYTDSNMLFNYIVAKQHFIENKRNLGKETAYKYLKRIRPRLSKDDVHRLYALILLEHELDNLDQFPNKQDVEVRFNTLHLD